MSAEKLQAFLAPKLGKSFLNAKLEKTAKERERLISKQGIKFVCTGKTEPLPLPPAPSFFILCSEGAGAVPGCSDALSRARCGAPCRSRRPSLSPR